MADELGLDVPSSYALMSRHATPERLSPSRPITSETHDHDFELRTKRVGALGAHFRKDSMDVVAMDSRAPSTQVLVRRMVMSDMFQAACAGLVLLNCVMLGWEVNCRAGNFAPPEEVEWISLAFCISFALELFIRVYAHGPTKFFSDQERIWNIFDALLVMFQVLDEVSTRMRSASWALNSRLGATMRAIRLLRLVRIVRALRLLRLSDELKALARSVYAALSSVCWALIFLCMVIYMFSVFFLQLIVSSGDLPEDGPMLHFFGTLPRTFLTLFECIFGGVSWDEVIVPLMAHVTSSVAFLFLAYITFCAMAVMNMATGLIVDSVRKGMEADNDRDLARAIFNVFIDEWLGGVPITQDLFISKTMESDVLQLFMRSIDVCPENAGQLYDLIDVERAGELTIDDVVEGCLRVRGPGRALEIQVVTRAIESLQRSMAQLASIQVGYPADVD